jgi:hypothetical protein
MGHVLRCGTLEGVELIFVPPGDGYVRAIREECERDRTAKAACAAGNENDLI